jgi:ABC-type cobalamin/Fe3+-siderophores transport system ATPase subunit
MGNLILNSLEIRNFRGFEHLTIEHLGRVNLIVGKNNIGKSSLLEALQLYARRGSPELIWDILRTREELRVVAQNATVMDLLVALKYLFYGRKDVRTHFESIQIGPANSPEGTLFIAFGWSTVELDEKGTRNVRPISPEEVNKVANLIPRLNFQLGKEWGASYPIDPALISVLLNPETREVKYVSIPANGLDRGLVAQLWDTITLTPLQQEVLASLRIVAPGTEGINIVGDRESPNGIIPIVKIAEIDEPLPLNSLGDGMQRMLGIVLALVNAKDGMVMIDEIENGIHYSAQNELWQMVFRLAHRLNVQVFATTHSWDCIEGFAKAAQKDTEEEGMLIRLSLPGDDIIATLFDERKLGIATREQFEVR